MDETELSRGLARIRARSGDVGNAKAGPGQGAGFLVGRDTVVTCAHVVDAALARRPSRDRPEETVLVDFPSWPDHDPVEAEILQDGWFPPDEERGDVAILRILGDPPPDARQPPLRRPPAMMDHTFHVEGFPAKIGDAWATGAIRGATHGGHWVQLEDVKVPGHRIERGFSGAPVWDDEAQAVVGIIVITELDEATKAARMIPVSALVRLWPRLEQAVGWRLGYDEDDLRKHWGPKARGLRHGRGARAPWLFTGRTRALRELVAWLEQSGPTPGCIVTGGPGSGKSAVISRLVTLADPSLRREAPTESAPEGTVPPAGAIDVAVHANGKTLEVVVAKIAGWLDVAAGSAEDLVATLVDRGRACTIVVDALDEASGGDAVRIATELLSPLASDGGEVGVKVLVGTRPGPNRLLLRKLAGMTVVNLDDDLTYLDRQDLVEYVRRYLLEGDGVRASPYAGEAELARRVAEAVALRAAPSFLVAQLGTDSLVADTEVVDPEQPGWEQRIPDSVGRAMERYFSRFGQEEGRVRDLFRPLAFAEGAGLPRGDSLWAALASALAGRRYSDDDVAWLLDTPAADYLIEGGAGTAGRGAVRLYHEALAEYLRCAEPDEAEIAARFAEVLLGRLPVDPDGRPRWSEAGPYTRSHLAAHAARGGQLDRLIADPGFLLAAEPTRLLRALPSATGEGSAVIAGVYRRAVTQIRDRPPGEAASYLELHAHQAGAASLARHIAELGIARRWSTRWVNWRASHEYTTVGHHGADVSAIAAHEVDGEPVAVSGGEDGTVRIWSTVRCDPMSPPLRGHDGHVSAIATGDLDGDPLAVTGGWDGTLRVWDLRAAVQVGDPLRGHERGITTIALGELDGRQAIVSASWDNTVRVWDLRTHEPVGEPILAHTRGVTALALGELDGTPIAVSAGYETLRLWDLRRGRALRDEPLRRHAGGVSALALGCLDGEPIAVSGGWDQALWLWDLKRWRPLRDEPLGRHAGGITAVAMVERGGVPTIVSGAEDGTVRTWDPRTGSSRVIEVGTAVLALALGELDGRLVAVSGGAGESVRVWDLADVPVAARETPRTRGQLTSVAIAGGATQSVVSGSDDGTVAIWDDDGRALAEADAGSPVFAVATGTLDGRPVALSGGWDGVIRLWDARSGAALGDPLGGHEDWVAALTTVALDGQPCLLSGGADCAVRLWDLRARRQLRELRGHGGTVTAIQVAVLDGATLAVTTSTDGTVRAWDIAASADPHGDRLGAHDDEALAVAVAELDGAPVAATAGLDGAVRIWDLRGRRPLRDPLVTPGGCLRAVALIQLGDRPVALVGCDERLHAWDLRDGTASVIDVGAPVSGLATDRSSCLVSCALGLVRVDLAAAT
jgi:WD40 repeat protein